MTTEEKLRDAHKHACRAAFLIGLMLVRRKMSRQAIEESLSHLQQSAQALESLSTTPRDT